MADYSSGDYLYSVATRADEPVVRDILARISMGGMMRLSLRREPDAFAADFGALAQGYILARDRHSGAWIGLCERQVREVFVNGVVTRLPYLAALRVLPEFRNRVRALRGGFEAVRRLLARPGDLCWSLTSVMDDNHAARRVLTARLSGMPRYEPAGEFSTFALAAARGADCERATAADLPGIAGLLLERAVRQQFSSHWSADMLRTLADTDRLKPEDYLLLRRGSRIEGCVAVWDQSAYRQVVVTGYAPWIARFRPLINLGARLARRPALPAPGERLRLAYLSHFALRDENPADFARLLAAGRAEAFRRGIATVLTGCAFTHPLAQTVRAHARVREFRSQLYAVYWPEDEAPRIDPDLPIAPELALL